MFPTITLFAACLAYASTVFADLDLKALIGGLSPQCQAAAGGLVTSEFGACANIMGLIPVISASGSALAPLSTWIDGICAAPACSPSIVSTATSGIASGCAADAQKGVATAIGITAIVSNYSVIRDTLCYQYASNHSRCSTSVLDSIEKSGGKPLSIVEVEGFLTTGFAGLAPLLGTAPKFTICNDCGHALFTTLSASKLAGVAANGTAAANATATVGGGPAAVGTAGIVAICGPSFADGKIPSTIVGPNGTTPAQPSGSPSAGGDKASGSPSNGAPTTGGNAGSNGSTSSANSISLSFSKSAACIFVTMALALFL